MWYAKREAVNSDNEFHGAMASVTSDGFYEKTDAYAALLVMIEREIIILNGLGIEPTREHKIRERLVNGETDVTEDGVRFCVYSV